MKVLALIVCVVYLTLSAHGISDEDKQKIKSYHQECQSNPATHIEKDVIDKVLRGEEVDKRKLSAHSLCMNKKMGIQKENGEVDKEKLKKALSKGISDETILKQVVDKCSEQKATAEETAQEVMKCFHKYVGQQIHKDDEHHDQRGENHSHN